MLVQSGKYLAIFINKDEVAFVERNDPETVTVVYTSGTGQFTTYDYKDPNIAQNIWDLFVADPDFVKLRDGGHCLNVRRVRKIEFVMGEAKVTLPSGKEIPYTTKKDWQALYEAVGGM